MNVGLALCGPSRSCSLLCKMAENMGLGLDARMSSCEVLGFHSLDPKCPLHRGKRMRTVQKDRQHASPESAQKTPRQKVPEALYQKFLELLVFPPPCALHLFFLQAPSFHLTLEMVLWGENRQENVLRSDTNCLLSPGCTADGERFRGEQGPSVSPRSPQDHHWPCHWWPKYKKRRWSHGVRAAGQNTGGPGEFHTESTHGGSREGVASTACP